MILFDTDTATHYFYGKESVQRRVDERGNPKLAIAIITFNEMLRGRADNLLKAADEEELRTAVERYQQTRDFIASFSVVALEEVAIQHFGKLRKQKNLKKIGRGDMLIACIALANDALLVTRNTKDFKDVHGLQIENWVD